MVEFKPIYIGIILFFLLFIAGLSGFAEFSVNKLNTAWDKHTEEHLDKLLVNAGTAYATSRGLNALISVIQDSDINIVIGNLALGEALDPVNDIVERFSHVMLMSITSIGIQKFIFTVGKSLGVNVFLTLFALFLFIALSFRALPYLKGEKIIHICQTMAHSFLIIFLFIRFIIPLVTLFSWESEKIFGNEMLDRISKLENIQEESQLQFNQVSQNMEKIEVSRDNGEKSLFFRIKDSIVETGRKINDNFNILQLKENINKAIQSLKESIDYITDLIIIFLIQTIVIPILTLFLLKASFQPLINLIFRGVKKEVKIAQAYSVS